MVKYFPFPVNLTSCSALSSDDLPLLIDTTCRFSFQHPLDRPDYRRTDWPNFQVYLDDQIPFDPELHNGMAIDTSVEKFCGAGLKALAASTPKCRTRDDPRLPIPAGIQDEIRLKIRRRKQWQITRDPALKADVNRLKTSVTRWINEWRNGQLDTTLESLDRAGQTLWRMTKPVMRVPTPSPNLVTTGAVAVSDSEKAEALADNLEDQFFAGDRSFSPSN